MTYQSDWVNDWVQDTGGRDEPDVTAPPVDDGGLIEAIRDDHDSRQSAGNSKGYFEFGLGHKPYPKSMGGLAMIDDIIESERKSPWREFHEKYADVHFPDNDISDAEWNRKYMRKINPPRKYWGSPEERAECMAWTESQSVDRQMGDEDDAK